MSKSRFADFNLDPALAEAVEAAPEQIIEGILRLEEPTQIPPQFDLVCRFIRICTGRFLAADAWTIRSHPNVVSLKAARPLGIYQCCGDVAEIAETESVVQRTNPSLPFSGRGCIVAALDFGLDFSHPNFLNPDGTTRLTAFWNQGATYDAAYPNRYGYGRVFSRDEIDAALRTSNPYQTLGYHPAISDTGNGSHGTHTLDIAAGNGRAPRASAGVAPNADLLFVHLSTPRLGSAGDLGDSVRMLEALDFVDRTAGNRPWVVNLSVGRTAGCHDGTSPVEQGMHEVLRLGPGRAIVQSAGNYRSADLAVESRLGDGEHRDLEWIIDPRDTTPNEIDAWYSGNDRFIVSLQPPEGGELVEVRLGEVEDVTHTGNLVGRIYHRRNDPNNRDNHVEVFLYRGAPSGVWTLRLIGEYVIHGRFHAWIERDLANPGAQSHFDRKITSQSYTLGTIATSPLVITVGAYDASAEGGPLAPFSSCGPTRDGRHDKPELLAPGVRVVAARSTPRGAVQQEGLLVPRSGTSMASPHAAGAVAVMFEAAGRPVAIDEIRDCLRSSAQHVTDSEHADCCGWGRLNTAEAIRRIRDVTAPALDSAPQLDASVPGSWITISGTADANLGENSTAPEEQRIELPQNEGVFMNSDLTDRFLDRAEQALRNSNAGRSQSETSFLQQLIRELDSQVFAPSVSPASLFHAAVRDNSLMQSTQNLLRILALPAQQPEAPLRAGDWMLRVAPGTGDVGHVSVLVSGDLVTPSAIAAEGIAAEGTHPGYYGMVIEGGAFPHSRKEPFARRFLDGRGRVPAHTVILRPQPEEPDSSEEYKPPAWLKIEHRSQSASREPYLDFEATDEADSSDGFTPPAWLKIEERTPSRPGQAESLDSEDFTFEPTGAQTDFGPKLRKVWHAMIQAAFIMNIDKVTHNIALRLAIADADATKHVRFFSPASRPPAITLSGANVKWRALPTSFGSPSLALYKFVDKPQLQGGQVLRVQDEYCEWQVFRDKANKIVRVVFTSEPPEYYMFLYDPGVPSLTKFSRELLVRLYQERCGSKAVTLADLEQTIGANTAYNSGNKWNNQHCVHLQQPNNTLGAQINIAARAAVVRSDSTGKLITNVKTLIGCDGFGDPNRQSDPFIGDNVNQRARENRFLTLENPVGLYMTSLDTSGWTTPDGTDAHDFWTVLKGKKDKDPAKSMIVRAEYAVPVATGYTVSDIKIAGVPIDFGAQIAEHLEMRLGALFGPKDKDLKGGTLSAPTPLVC